MIYFFSRGDTRSIALVMEALGEFSKSTGLVVNSEKCQIYFGSVDDKTKHEIQNLTNFKEGPLPLRYLGIPLTGKKLYVQQFMILKEKIVSRVKHWSAELLSLAGRL